MVFLRRWPRWPRVRHEMPYSSPVGGGSAQPGTQMTYHTFCFVLFVFGACIRMIFIHMFFVLACICIWYSLIFLSIYIYRNAWALPQSCTIEVPIHIQLGRSTKVLGKIYSRRRCGSGQSPGIWRTYIYIHSYPIRPRLPHDYMFWCSNDTLFRQRQWVPYLVFWRLLWLYPRFSGCPPILADISVVGRILTFIPNPKWSKSLAFLYISPNSVATLRGSYGKC